MANANLEVLGSFGQLLKSRKYSDLIIRESDETTHQVHKAIVAAQSTYLQELIQKPTNNSVSETTMIQLPDIQHRIVEQIINFLYAGTYNTSAWNDNAKDHKAIDASLDIYIVARTLKIPALQDRVLSNLTKLLSCNWMWTDGDPSEEKDVRADINVVMAFLRKADQLSGGVDERLEKLMRDTCSFYAAEVCESEYFQALAINLPRLTLHMARTLSKRMKVMRHSNFGWEDSPTLTILCPSWGPQSGEFIGPRCIIGRCQSSTHGIGRHGPKEIAAQDERQQQVDETTDAGAAST